MKQIRRISLLKESIIFIAAAIILVAFSSCATRKATFLSSAVVPAAEGTVKVKKDNNKNYTIIRCLYPDNKDILCRLQPVWFGQVFHFSTLIA